MYCTQLCTQLRRKMTTETSTFVGETATSVGDGYAGFRIGRRYQLQVEHRGDTVAIMLDHHEHVSPGAGPMVVSSEQFEKWFRK
jgi:hypothetical protein